MTIYFIRHAQSRFNAEFWPSKIDPMIPDAPLSALGETQAQKAADQVAGLGIRHVIVSPLTRALQTASLMFGADHPMQVVPTIREQLCHSCDIGSPPAELKKNYPHLDFAHLPEIWWHEPSGSETVVPTPDNIIKESLESLQARAARFVAYLRTNRLTDTAVVSHGNFIREVTGVQPDNCQVVPFEVS